MASNVEQKVVWQGRERHHVLRGIGGVGGVRRHSRINHNSSFQNRAPSKESTDGIQGARRRDGKGRIVGEDKVLVALRANNRAKLRSTAARNSGPFDHNDRKFGISARKARELLSQ